MAGLAETTAWRGHRASDPSGRNVLIRAVCHENEKRCYSQSKIPAVADQLFQQKILDEQKESYLTCFGTGIAQKLFRIWIFRRCIDG